MLFTPLGLRFRPRAFLGFIRYYLTFVLDFIVILALDT